MSFSDHTANVTAVGFQKDRKWMYTGSEDGSVKIYDTRYSMVMLLPRYASVTLLLFRAPGYQRNYQMKSPVNTVVLHPNQVRIVYLCMLPLFWV